jgi:phosphoribosylamine--glycine ligase
MKLPQSVNVLLLGSGGREHALAWKIARSRRLAKLYISPGNAGTRACGTNADVSPTNFAGIKQFVLANNINLVVVGPEEPLVKGIVDFFTGDPDIHHVPVIGPSQQGARLEGSKDFAKAFMTRHNIPTAAYRSFTKKELEEGLAFLETLKPPYVLKADGLAAGKGVVILDSLKQARRELADMLEGKFGAASQRVVIEEYLKGIECSLFVATDGKSYKILPEAKDYKRIGVGDSGPNTGGMGAVSPVPFCDRVFMEKVRTRIVEPTVEGLKKEKIKYNGFIFVGLINVGGEPYVIEYNVRLGDPETEAVLPRITSDIIDLLEGIAHGTLSKKEIAVSPDTAVTVVCVSGGYPGDYEKGKVVSGLDDRSESLVFHAGTALKGKDTVTAGGRVLAVTSLGASIEAAARRSFEAIAGIDYEGLCFRADIGKDLL